MSDSAVILVTTLFYKALMILQDEIWCWSLLGFEGLSLLCLDSLLWFFEFALLSLKIFHSPTISTEK